MADEITSNPVPVDTPVTQAPETLTSTPSEAVIEPVSTPTTTSIPAEFQKNQSRFLRILFPENSLAKTETDFFEIRRGWGAGFHAQEGSGRECARILEGFGASPWYTFSINW